MSALRPVALSVAGFDPSAGAGLLADIKTFEQFGVYGIAIPTAQTLQTEKEFISIRWEDPVLIQTAIQTMFSRYCIKAVKIGIVRDAEMLAAITRSIRDNDPGVAIVYDPVLSSSSGFAFSELSLSSIREVMPELNLITPNFSEACELTGKDSALDAAHELSSFCNVLLKGGHNPAKPGTDYLYYAGTVKELPPCLPGISPKHGSGCVMSSAIASGLAKELELLPACIDAKLYVEKYLSSSPTLLGYHYV